MANIIIFSGLPGSGKTVLSSLLKEKLNAVVLSSDQVRLTRAQLFDEPRTYSAEESAGVFAFIQAEAEHCLKYGSNVIVDATNLTNAQRSVYFDLADRQSAKAHLVVVSVPEKELVARMKRRFSGEDDAGNSEADMIIHDRLKSSWEEPSDPFISIDTSKPKSVEDGVKKLVAQIQES